LDDLDIGEKEQLFKASETFLNYDGKNDEMPTLSPEMERLRSITIKVTDPVVNIAAEPILLLMTTANGRVIYYGGTPSAVSKIEEDGLHIGSSFSIEHAGINAISLCHHVKQTVVVQGAEHSLSEFSNWNCLCTPIMVDGDMLGMLDLSFDHLTNIAFAVPLLLQMVNQITDLYSLEKTSEGLREEKFNAYSFTKREKEIAVAWLENKTVPEIASELTISEQTVRTFIKKIYAKTNVGSKGDLFQLLHL